MLLTHLASVKHAMIEKVEICQKLLSLTRMALKQNFYHEKDITEFDPYYIQKMISGVYSYPVAC